MLRHFPLTAGLLVALNLAAINATRADDEDGGEPAATGMVDVKLGDGTSIKLVLQQETYGLQTPYGKLTIPAKDVRLIELAPRVAEDVAKQLEEAVANLGSPQFEIREKAAADLLRLGPLGYPVLLRLAKDKRSDLEVSARLDDVIEKVHAKVPDNQGEPREWDVVHTEHSRVSGHLEMNTVKAVTAQFGEVQLKLADVRDLRFQGSIDGDLAKAEPAPAHLYDKADQIGKTFTYKIKGNAGAGTLWGTDTYTLDSALAAAVVHAGVVKDGKEGVVRLKIVPSPASFTGSTRNGVSSHNYGAYPAAYKILKR
jgi:hypothetical protein